MPLSWLQRTSRELTWHQFLTSTAFEFGRGESVNLQRSKAWTYENLFVELPLLVSFYLFSQNHCLSKYWRKIVVDCQMKIFRRYVHIYLSVGWSQIFEKWQFRLWYKNSMDNFRTNIRGLDVSCHIRGTWFQTYTYQFI